MLSRYSSKIYHLSDGIKFVVELLWRESVAEGRWRPSGQRESVKLYVVTEWYEVPQGMWNPTGEGGGGERDVDTFYCLRNSSVKCLLSARLTAPADISDKIK